MHCRDTRLGKYSADALISELSDVVSRGLVYPFEQLAIDLQKHKSDEAALSGAAAEAAEARARTVSGELRSSFGKVFPLVRLLSFVQAKNHLPSCAGDNDPNTSSDRFLEAASELAARHGAILAEAKQKYQDVESAMKELCSYCGERSDPKVWGDRIARPAFFVMKQQYFTLLLYTLAVRAMVQGGDAWHELTGVGRRCLA